MTERNIERAVEWRTTLLELKMLLSNTPDVFGNKENTIRQAVVDADEEISKTGGLSQETKEKLDNLHRPFKTI